MTTPRT